MYALVVQDQPDSRIGPPLLSRSSVYFFVNLDSRPDGDMAVLPELSVGNVCTLTVELR
jgi:hypothetical protein